MDIAKQNIISILGIADLPDERKVAIIQQATDLVQKRLLVRFIDGLDEAKKKEFNKLLDHGQNKEIADYIAANAPEFGKWIEEETLKVKQELADLSKQ